MALTLCFKLSFFYINRLYNSTGCIKYNEKFERIYDQNARSVVIADARRVN